MDSHFFTGYWVLQMKTNGVLSLVLALVTLEAYSTSTKYRLCVQLVSFPGFHHFHNLITSVCIYGGGRRRYCHKQWCQVVSQGSTRNLMRFIKGWLTASGASSIPAFCLPDSIWHHCMWGDLPGLILPEFAYWKPGTHNYNQSYQLNMAQNQNDQS